MRWRDQSGSVLVDVVGASGLLLIVVLGTMTWSNQISDSQVELKQRSAALNAARLLVEQQANQALADPSAYRSRVLAMPAEAGALASVPALAGTTGLTRGQYSISRTLRHPTGGGVQPVGSVNLFDLTVEVTWARPGGSTGKVAVTKSVFQR